MVDPPASAWSGVSDGQEQQQLLDAILSVDQQQGASTLLSSGAPSGAVSHQHLLPSMSSSSAAAPPHAPGAAGATGVAAGMGGAPLLPTQDWLDQLMMDASLASAGTNPSSDQSMERMALSGEQQKQDQYATTADLSQILPSTQQQQQTASASYSTLSALQREHNQIDPRFYSSNFNLSPEALSQQQTQTSSPPPQPQGQAQQQAISSMPLLGRGDEQLMSYFFDPADFNDMYEQALVSLQHSSPSSTMSGSAQEGFTPPFPHAPQQHQHHEQQEIPSPDLGPSTQQLVDQLSHWYASTSRTETRPFDRAPGAGSGGMTPAQIYQQQAMQQHMTHLGLEEWHQQMQSSVPPGGPQQGNQYVADATPSAYPHQQHAPSNLPGYGYGGPSPSLAQPPGWISATGTSSSGPSGSGGEGGRAIGKRKAGDFEAPPALPGTRNVPQQVFGQRQQEQQRSKNSRTVVEVSPSCMGGCGKTENIAVLLFHNSDSLAQVNRDYIVKAFCEDCGGKRGLMRPAAQQQPQQATQEPAAVVGAAGGVAEEGGVRDSLSASAISQRPGDGCRRCDLCKRRIGSIEILNSPTNPTEGPSPTEVLCTICDARYAFCTQCGGGNRYRTGKWRPKALFPPGRKTCRLRSIRLSGTPRIEVYDVGVKGETIPDDVLNGCRVTFENKFLFRFAKPMFMSDEVDLQRLEQIVQRWWSWIHTRLTEPKSSLPKDLHRLLTCLRGQITAVGKGKATEEAVITYQVMEWTPEQRAVELVNSCMALTGIVSMRHLANAGKAGIYRILLKAHEQDDENGLPREPYSSAERRLPWPEKLVRLETDMEWERIYHFLNAGWKESARLPLEMASECSKHQWQHRMEETLAEIDGDNNKRKTLVTLEWKFDMAMAVPPECSVLQRVGTSKTTFRAFTPGEKLKFPAYPLVRYVGDYWNKHTIDPEFHRP